MLCQEIVRPHGAFRVVIIHRTSDGYYDPSLEMLPRYQLERRPINAQTGKPWQAWRIVQIFTNPNQARRAWLYSINPTKHIDNPA